MFKWISQAGDAAESEGGQESLGETGDRISRIRRALGDSPETAEIHGACWEDRDGTDQDDLNT